MPRTPDYWAGLGWAGLAMGSGRFRLTKSAIGADRLRRCASRPQRPQLPGHHPLEIQQHRPRLQQLIRLLRAQQLGLVAEGVVITALENRAPSPDPHCSCWDPRHRSRGEGIDQNDVVSSKWRALRVASLASCAKAMPAISVSRRSTGRPPAGGGGWHRGDSPHQNAARTPPRSVAIPFARILRIQPIHDSRMWLPQHQGGHHVGIQQDHGSNSAAVAVSPCHSAIGFSSPTGVKGYETCRRSADRHKLPLI